MSEPLTSRSPEVLAALGEVFGHADYRHGQADIIDSVLAGRPTLAILPTGGGKSLCYQLPAVVLDGLTLVVSPLIALIRDQVQALTARGVAAASLTSADDDQSRREALAALREGRLDLLYVAPERLRSPSFLDLLVRAGVSTVAIDEAHCISSWGHDFRPDYARLGELLRALAPRRVLALTATATPEVRRDIVDSLGLEGARSIVTGFDRPNLALSVEAAGRLGDKLDATDAAMARWLGRAAGSRGPGCAIVYTATRRRSEEVAAALEQRGWRAAAYHAGLDGEVRARAHDRFADGDVDAVVATTAFGMGVDKPDVRVVVHFEIPSSVEGYYQEVGRGGRDGAPAGGVLLFDTGDLRFAYLRIESSCPTADAVERAHRCLGAWSDPDGRVYGGFDELVDRLEPEVGPAARAALIVLERAGAVAIEPGAVAVRGDRPQIDGQALDRRQRFERGKLDAMVGYVQRADCRRRYLVDYFGDPDRPEACGNCDRCTAPPVRRLAGEPAVDALKALSCVARMRGRWGKARVVDVLLGSSQKAVLDAGLDQLSTHGLLKDWRRDELLLLLDALARAGLVVQTFGEYPKLQLTPEGAEVLKARGPLELDLRLVRWGDEDGEGRPGRSGRRRERRPSEDAERGPLFDALRDWRRQVASELAKPPYVIAHDATLDAVCALAPTSLEALGEVPGIGPAKLARYGDAIVAIVRAHEETAEATG